MISAWKWAVPLVILVAACQKGGPQPNPSSPSARPSSATTGETKGGKPSPSAAASPGGPYWPSFHGPRGDNISSDTGLLKQWPGDGPKLLWSAKGLGHGFASVTIADGRIYTAGNIDDKTVVTALDLEGNTLWQAPNGPAWTGAYPGARGTPTIDGDRIYYESPVGRVVCLKAQDGQPLWSVDLLKEFDASNITWALAESVLIDGDRAICCPGGKKASVVALDKMTGKVVWAAKPTGDVAGYATPTLVECQGLRILLVMNQRALLGVSADNGDLLWRVEHETKYDVNATSPLYQDGQVFISSGYGSGSAMFKIQVDGKKAAAEQVWESRELDNQHGGLVLLDGFIYGAAHNRNSGRWICLDWKSGDKKYAERGVGKGSLTCADGMLYTLSESREVGLVPATPEKHQVVSRFKMPSGGEGPSWAHPVVCGGRLYLRHSDQLFAYDVKQ